MAIAKNTAKAVPAKVEEKKVAPKAAAPAAKAPAKAAQVSKAAPVAKAAPVKAVEVDKADAVTLGRKDIAAAIRSKVMASGMAISEKVAEVATVAYEEVLLETLAAGNKVALTGFGTFSVVHREAREATNPQKPGEKIHVAACDVPKFKAGSKLKAAVNGGADVAEEGDE